MNLINFGEHANPEFLKRRTLLAEELGYHSVMIPDHVPVTPDVSDESAEDALRFVAAEVLDLAGGRPR